MPSPCAVTATLNDPSGTALTSASFLRFRLRNFQGFVPRIIGAAVLTEVQVDAAPDGSGHVAVNIWGNDNIDPAGTYYTVEQWSNGRITSSGNFLITGVGVDLDTAPIVNPPALPANVTVQGIPQYTLLKTNGVQNGLQTELNLHSSDGSITLTDDGAGNVNLVGVPTTPSQFLARIQISSAQALAGTVIPVIPAPGAGKIAVPVWWSLKYIYGGVGYNASQGTSDLHTGATFGTGIHFGLAGVELWTNNRDGIEFASALPVTGAKNDSGSTPGDSTTFENSGWNFSFFNMISGNGNFVLSVVYYVIDTAYV